MLVWEHKHMSFNWGGMLSNCQLWSLWSEHPSHLQLWNIVLSGPRCHMGGFPKIHLNDIHDITASHLTEVCHSVATEPPLQPLDGETLALHSANVDGGACLDVCARGFWNRSQDPFLMFGFLTLTRPVIVAHFVFPVRRQETRNVEVKGVWSTHSWCPTWCFYSSSFHCHWRHGSLSDNLLPMTSRHDRQAGTSRSPIQPWWDG